MPPLELHPSNSSPPSTAEEYGLSAARQALKIRCPVGSGVRGADRNRLRLGQQYWPNFLDQFRLTRLTAEAYIQPLGAPSAYGAIARL